MGYVGYGEEGKWRWMARIAGLNESDFGGYCAKQDVGNGMKRGEEP